MGSRSSQSPAAYKREPGYRNKYLSLFGQPGGSAVLSMQGMDACSCHGSAFPCSASPADALRRGRCLSEPANGMHTHSRRSRAARGYGKG